MNGEIAMILSYQYSRISLPSNDSGIPEVSDKLLVEHCSALALTSL